VAGPPNTPIISHREKAPGTSPPLIASGRLPAPRLRATAEHGSWFALILDDIDGRHPALPWEDGQVSQVLDALDRLADVLTPPPGLPTVRAFQAAQGEVTRRWLAQRAGSGRPARG
jgi:hypothetical protein